MCDVGREIRTIEIEPVELPEQVEVPERLPA